MSVVNVHDPSSLFWGASILQLSAVVQEAVLPHAGNCPTSPAGSVPSQSPLSRQAIQASIDLNLCDTTSIDAIDPFGPLHVLELGPSANPFFGITCFLLANSWDVRIETPDNITVTAKTRIGIKFLKFLIIRIYR